MTPVNAQYTSNKITYSKIVCWTIIIFLLVFVVKNAKADAPLSRVMHHQVEVSSFAFIPKQLRVNTGDTITWTNKDIVPHNIIDSAHQKSISPDLSTGEIFTIVVKNSMLYECGLHPSMKGKISYIDSP
jgi:plastocyanin